MVYCEQCNKYITTQKCYYCNKQLCSNCIKLHEIPPIVKKSIDNELEFIEVCNRCKRALKFG